VVVLEAVVVIVVVVVLVVLVRPADQLRRFVADALLPQRGLTGAEERRRVQQDDAIGLHGAGKEEE